MVSAGACLRCGGEFRWRLLEPGGNVGCWTCWRCSPPQPNEALGRPGARVDILGLVKGRPRTLLDLPAESLNEQLFTHELAEFGAPIALDLKPLPCRCRVCSPRASAQRLVGLGQRS